MKEAYLSSGSFAKLCGTTKETLRHYDHLGLLKPKHIGSNGYHYYETVQFYEYYAINLMKLTGTPLSKIKSYLDNQHIPSILQLLKNQLQELLEQKLAIENMQFMVGNSIQNLELGIKIGSASLSTDIAYFEEEHLLVVPSYEFSSSVKGAEEEAIKLQDIRTIGDIYAYDLAGFMINGNEENNMTIISVQIEC